MMYDVIIVGARCAGSPTAMLLARMGYKVLLLDKAAFPSDTLSTHFIHQPGVARLKRWGLLDQVIASGCPPVRQQRLDFGPFALVASPPAYEGVEEGYGPRRTVLDKILVDAAVAAGAELRENFAVQEVLMEGEGVTGIRGHAIGGAPVTERARMVIGADGMRSFVARQVQAKSYNVRPTFTCMFYSYWRDLPVQGTELYPRPERMIILFPTNDNLTGIGVFWPNAAFAEVRGDLEGSFYQTLDLVPELAARVRVATRSERFRGTNDLPNFFRQAYGPGWALIGDAGYHKDPILAQGITDAFRDTELLVAALDDAFCGRQSFQDAFANYAYARDAQAAQSFEMSCQFATLAPPPPEAQQLLAALQGNQEQTNRYFGTVIGSYPAANFYAADNVAQIFASSAQRVAA
jgi:2-polyprenyl-6-methoxyphenol hydroxylase-like FAD-dependent oxidoreductase